MVMGDKMMIRLLVLVFLYCFSLAALAKDSEIKKWAPVSSKCFSQICIKDSDENPINSIIFSKGFYYFRLGGIDYKKVDLRSENGKDHVSFEILGLYFPESFGLDSENDIEAGKVKKYSESLFFLEPSDSEDGLLSVEVRSKESEVLRILIFKISED